MMEWKQREANKNKKECGLLDRENERVGEVRERRECMNWRE